MTSSPLRRIVAGCALAAAGLVLVASSGCGGDASSVETAALPSPSQPVVYGEDDGPVRAAVGVPFVVQLTAPRRKRWGVRVRGTVAVQTDAIATGQGTPSLSVTRFALRPTRAGDGIMQFTLRDGGTVVRRVDLELIARGD